MNLPMRDPAGENEDQQRLRSLGKWRFILTRGIIGFGIPMFVWMAASSLSGDVSDARAWHVAIVGHLLQSWLFRLFTCAFLGVVVGVLAWRRITSEIWPGAAHDPEDSMTRLGPLGPGMR